MSADVDGAREPEIDDVDAQIRVDHFEQHLADGIGADSIGASVSGVVVAGVCKRCGGRAGRWLDQACHGSRVQPGRLQVDLHPGGRAADPVRLAVGLAAHPDDVLTCLARRCGQCRQAHLRSSMRSSAVGVVPIWRPQVAVTALPGRARRLSGISSSHCWLAPGLAAALTTRCASAALRPFASSSAAQRSDATRGGQPQLGVLMQGDADVVDVAGEGTDHRREVVLVLLGIVEEPDSP
jgi:hypothetical protein